MTDTTQSPPADQGPPIEPRSGLPAPIAAGQRVMAIVPNSFDECWRVAKVAYIGGICPADCTSAENAMVRIMAGLEVGLPPMQALQSIAVINGKPVIWGDAAIALVLVSGKCDTLDEFEELRAAPGKDEKVLTAVCRTKRHDRAAVIERTWSVDDERVAQLDTKDIHKKFPKRMRQMRARAFCLRDAYADVLRGLALKEEVEDYTSTIEHNANEPPRAGTTTTTAGPRRQRNKAPTPPEPPALPKPVQQPMAPITAPAEPEKVPVEIAKPTETTAQVQIETRGQENSRSAEPKRDDDPVPDEEDETEFAAPQGLRPGEDITMDELLEDGPVEETEVEEIVAAVEPPPPPVATKPGALVPPEPPPLPKVETKAETKPETETPRPRTNKPVKRRRDSNAADLAWIAEVTAAYAACKTVMEVNAVFMEKVSVFNDKPDPSEPAWLTIEELTKKSMLEAHTRPRT